MCYACNKDREITTELASYPICKYCELDFENMVYNQDERAGIQFLRWANEVEND